MATVVSKEDWIPFFESAGFSPPEANHFAALFFGHKVRENLLPKLTINYLQAMGINVVGDMMMILERSQAGLRAENDDSTPASGTVAFMQQDRSLSFDSTSSLDQATVPVKAEVTQQDVQAEIRSAAIIEAAPAGASSASLDDYSSSASTETFPLAVISTVDASSDLSHESNNRRRSLRIGISAAAAAAATKNRERASAMRCDTAEVEVRSKRAKVANKPPASQSNSTVKCEPIRDEEITVATNDAFGDSGEADVPVAAQISLDGDDILERELSTSDESEIPPAAQFPSAKFSCANCEFSGQSKSGLSQHHLKKHPLPQQSPCFAIQPYYQQLVVHQPLNDAESYAVDRKFLWLQQDRQSGNIPLYCRYYEQHLWNLRAKYLSGEICTAEEKMKGGRGDFEINREIWARECLRYISEKSIFEADGYVTLDDVIELPEVTRHHGRIIRYPAKTETIHTDGSPASLAEIHLLPRIDFFGRATSTRTVPDLHRRIAKFADGELQQRKIVMQEYLAQRCREEGNKKEWMNANFDAPVRWPPNLPMAEEVLGMDGNSIEAKGGAVCDFSSFLVRISKLYAENKKRQGIVRILRECLPAPVFVDPNSPAATVNMEAVELQQVSVPDGGDSADGVFILRHRPENRLEPSVAEITIAEIQEVYFGKTLKVEDIGARTEYVHIKPEFRSSWQKIAYDTKTSTSIAEAETQFWDTIAARAVPGSEQGRPILRQSAQNFILDESAEVNLDAGGSSNLLRYVDPKLALLKTTIGTQHSALGWQCGLWELPVSIFNHGPTAVLAYVISRQHTAQFLALQGVLAPSTTKSAEEAVCDRRHFDALGEDEKKAFLQAKSEKVEFQRCPFALQHGNILIDPRKIVNAGIPVRKTSVAPGELLLIQGGSFYAIVFAFGTAILQKGPHLNMETLFYSDISVDYCTCCTDSLQLSPSDLQRRLYEIKKAIEWSPGKLSFPGNNICVCGAQFMYAQGIAYHRKKCHANPAISKIDEQYAPLTWKQWKESAEYAAVAERTKRQLKADAAKKARAVARKAGRSGGKAMKGPKKMSKKTSKKSKQKILRLGQKSTKSAPSRSLKRVKTCAENEEDQESVAGCRQITKFRSKHRERPANDSGKLEEN